MIMSQSHQRVAELLSGRKAEGGLPGALELKVRLGDRWLRVPKFHWGILKPEITPRLFIHRLVYSAK